MARQEETINSQQELTGSKNRFTYVAKATSDAIWERECTDDQCFWGEGCTLLFGYTLNEETNSIYFWESKIHPDDRTRVINSIQSEKENPVSSGWTCEYRFLKANGEYAF